MNWKAVKWAEVQTVVSAEARSCVRSGRKWTAASYCSHAPYDVRTGSGYDRGGVADIWRRRDVMAATIVVRALLLSLVSVYFHSIGLYVKLAADATGHCGQVRPSLRYSQDLHCRSLASLIIRVSTRQMLC